MAFFKGTATDYHDMLTILNKLVQDDHVSAVTVQDGGTGYALGDTISLAGGTKNHEPELMVRGATSGDYITVAAVNTGGTGYGIGDSLVPTTGTYTVAPELEVLTLSGSAVATILIKNPGVASAQPTNPVVTTSDGAGTGCTIDFTFTAGTGIITACHIADAGVYTTQATNPVAQNTTSGSGVGAEFNLTYTDTAWETKVNYVSEEATAAIISVAGTGYTEDDKVTVVGGSFTEATVVNIDSESGGVPTAVSVYSAGDYVTTPGNPAATSGGTGSGLTLTVTWDDSVEEWKSLMIHNTTSDQYIGWRAHKDTIPEDAYTLQCTGFTGFNSVSIPWDQHPGSSAATATKGTYLPLSGGSSPATINYWISVQDERVAGMFKVASVYPNMYLGAPDTFLTDAEWGYPQVILGCLTQEHPYTYGGVDFAGMNNPGAKAIGSSTYPGPGWLRWSDGNLYQIANWEESSGNPSYVYGEAINISPSGGTSYPVNAAPNNWYSPSNYNWREMFKEQLTISAGLDELRRVNDEFILVPCVLSTVDGIIQLYGNLNGIFAINPDGDVNAEDQIWVNGAAYRCFQNCTKSNRNYFFAMREN